MASQKKVCNLLNLIEFCRSDTEGYILLNKYYNDSKTSCIKRGFYFLCQFVELRPTDEITEEHLKKAEIYPRTYKPDNTVDQESLYKAAGKSTCELRIMRKLIADFAKYNNIDECIDASKTPASGSAQAAE